MAYAEAINRRQHGAALVAAVLLQAGLAVAVLQGLLVTGLREPLPLRDGWPITFVTLPPPPPCDCLPPQPPKPRDRSPEPPKEYLATPSNAPGAWVTIADYPAKDLREGNEGLTGFRLAIDRRGNVTSCTITTSSGFPSLDEATCRSVKNRARFDAATDEHGRRVTSTYANRVRWRMDY